MGKVVKRKLVALSVGTAFFGGILCLTPFGVNVEENVGLGWLFEMRGARPAPIDVVVVTADKESALDLKLPQEPWKWPRSLHGELVQKLTDMGATVIAFDLFFKEASDSIEDGKFAKAMAQSNNVILFEKLTTPHQDLPGVFMRKSPIPILADASLALAPNPLPAVPFRVNQFWLFDETPDHAPTLPMLAFQTHVLAEYGILAGLVQRVSPEHVAQMPQMPTLEKENKGLQRFVQELRKFFQRNPQLPGLLLEELSTSRAEFERKTRNHLRSLIKTYSSLDRNRYLDFYGPPRSITTIPYSHVVKGNVLGDVDVRDKAVLVGFSEQIASEQQDRFHTVFTSESGIYISGVEIAATALANLVEDRQITGLTGWQRLLVLTIWAILITAAFHMVNRRKNMQPGIWAGVTYLVTGVGVGGLYLAMAYVGFSWNGWWFPLVIPLLVQVPCGLFGSLFWKLWDTHRERQNIQRALEHYVPAPVAQKLSSSIEEIKTTSELVEGVCLATDAEHYTTLAESFELEQLREFMNEYYEAIFEPVRRKDGIVSDVVGDAVLAIWAAPRLDQELRQKVCEAALEITIAVEQFNRRHPATPLPTRMGLHGGKLLLGNVGAMDHYEYRALGDIVNTATRIEGLNKYLGTRVLVSEDVLRGLEGFRTRELGRFRLVGKTQPLMMFELQGTLNMMETWHEEALRTFEFGLQAFRNQRWDEASTAFETYLATYGSDGPSLYYVEASKKFKAHPPHQTWAGEIVLQKK